MKKIDKMIPNWYLDMLEIIKYWDGNQRAYHHTAPINMMYALYQSLKDVVEEGLDNVLNRHLRVHEYLVKELSSLDIDFLVRKESRLPSLNAIKIPHGIDDLKIRNELLYKYSIEVGGGLGPFAGKVWRIGLMGFSAHEKNVDNLTSALKELL